MIPILYPREENRFNNNGIGRLPDCISCKVTEERNGIYELQFQYPITGLHYSDIQEQMIVYSIHDDTKTPQPFRIYSRSAVMNGVVTFYAHHISYDLGLITLNPFTATSCAQALSMMKTNTVTYNPFTYWTNKSVNATYKITVPSNAKGMLGGQSGSILDVFGPGDYEFDHWNIKLYQDRGTNTGIKIQYGKNLSNLTHKTDYSGLYSAVVPFWQDSSDTSNVVMIPETYILSENAEKKTYNWTEENDANMTDQNGNVFQFNQPQAVIVPLDLSSEFQERPTVAQLKEKAAAQLASSQAWIPDDNVTVSFVQLWQTPEYANVAPLERVNLCDTVDVYYPELGVTAVNKKVIKVVYDVLLERYSSMEIGTPKVSFAQSIQATTEVSIAKQYPSRDMLADAITHATEVITGAHGGYIIDKYDADGNRIEMLIMDAPTEAEAVEVWRWNLGGLGHSHNGVNGPFGDIALTQDGQIVANLITAGTLIGNIIKAGIISDVTGSSWWNMETGSARFAGDIVARSLTLVNTSIPTSDISGLAAVATSGSYNDLNPNTVPDLTIYIQEDGTYGTIPADPSQTTNTPGFKVSSAGLLTAANAIINGTVYAKAGYFTGKITSAEGEIGGWKISTNEIYKIATISGYDYRLDMHSNPSAGGNYAFFTSTRTNDGTTTGSWSYPFSVSYDGTLRATKANITGTISGSTIKSSIIDLWDTASPESEAAKFTVSYRYTYNSKTYLNQTQVWADRIRFINLNETDTRLAGETRITANEFRFGFQEANSSYVMQYTLTGGLLVGAAAGYKIATPLGGFVSNAYFNDSGTNRAQLLLAASSDTNYQVALSIRGSVWGLAPYTDNKLRLGNASYRWTTVYAASSTISTSDKRLKKNIKKLSDKYEELFNGLRPVSYKLKNGTSGRTHVGFIAQDVEESMTKAGLTAMDFAGLCHDDTEDGDIYSLRYEEFIALNTQMIQKQAAMIEKLTVRIDQLEAELSKLKEE